MRQTGTVRPKVGKKLNAPVSLWVKRPAAPSVSRSFRTHHLQKLINVTFKKTRVKVQMCYKCTTKTPKRTATAEAPARPSRAFFARPRSRAFRLLQSPRVRRDTVSFPQTPVFPRRLQPPQRLVHRVVTPPTVRLQQRGCVSQAHVERARFLLPRLAVDVHREGFINHQAYVARLTHATGRSVPQLSWPRCSAPYTTTTSRPSDFSLEPSTRGKTEEEEEAEAEEEEEVEEVEPPRTPPPPPPPPPPLRSRPLRRRTHR